MFPEHFSESLQIAAFAGRPTKRQIADSQPQSKTLARQLSIRRRSALTSRRQVLDCGHEAEAEFPLSDARTVSKTLQGVVPDIWKHFIRANGAAHTSLGHRPRCAHQPISQSAITLRMMTTPSAIRMK